MGRSLARCTTWFLGGILLLASTGRVSAQTYPLFPDQTRRPGWWSPYSWQGPLPIQQQPSPILEGSDARGWTGTASPMYAPPPPPRPVAVKRIEKLPNGLTERDFYPSRELPRGAREALTHILPTGGVELYLMLEPGVQLLPNLAECARELTFVEGEGTAAVGPEGPRPLREGDRVGVPPRAPHELACGGGGPCLIQIRTDGPLRLQWLTRRAEPAKRE